MLIGSIRKWQIVCAIQLALLAFPSATSIAVSGQTSRSVFTGRITDQAGFAVVDAEIELRSSNGSTACRPDNRGTFKCYLDADGKIELTIRADGFSILRQFITNIQETNDIGQIILRPAELRESVVVSVVKSPTSIVEAPASVYLIDREDIKTAPAASIDDVLKRGVGFSLFRRSGSRTSNPTTQGASIRGVNASGASRALVLLDGIPVNDPFGGWVVWSRIPKANVERIEVFRGASSAYYGSGSLGGTIVVVPKTAERKFDFSTEISAGTDSTFDGSFFTGLKAKRWNLALGASAFQTRGYKIVERAGRGVVDDFANSQNTNVNIRVIRELGRNARISAASSFFGERRNNGTPVQKNRTHIRSYTLGAEAGLGLIGTRFKNTRVDFRFFGGTQVFDQKFSAVFANRSGEALVRLQRVPAQQTGYTGNLFTLYKGHSLALGIDGIQIRGASDETGFFGGIATSKTGSGGRERRQSLYIRDFLKLNSRINLTGAVRYDRWTNFRGVSVLRRLATDSTTVTTFSDRTEDSFSPSAAVMASLGKRWSVYFSAGRSFRSPTLNELYRGFRVGNIITDPNAFLRAEKAFNWEGGTRYSRDLFFFQANFFRTTVDDAISNVTFDPGPPLILRRRENAGRISSTGIEIEAELRTNSFTLSSGYLFLNAKVDRFRSNTRLEGLRLPQVPAHQFTIQADYRPAEKWRLAVLARAGSSQFDDDLNMLRLGRYSQIDIYGSLRIGKKAEVFAFFENFLNTRNSVRLTPVRTIGPPFAIRAGIRWN